MGIILTNLTIPYFICQLVKYMYITPNTPAPEYVWTQD